MAHNRSLAQLRERDLWIRFLQSKILCLAFLLAAPAAHAISALSSLPAPERPGIIQMLTNHVIRSDRDGLALHTDTNEEVLFGPSTNSTKNSFTNYVTQIFERAERWNFTNRSATIDGKPIVRLLIHIHGGLNSWDDTVKRMGIARRIMKAKPTDQYYPIFVAWPSSYGSCYWEHSWRLRQGNRSSNPFTVAATPLIVATDLAKGIVTMPISWSYQLANTKNRLCYRDDGEGLRASLVSRNYKMAIFNQRREDIINNDYHFLAGQSDRAASAVIYERYALGVLSTPLRATLGTIGEGQMTASAWQVMKRRTGNLFYPPDRFEMLDHDQPAYTRLQHHAAAGDFFHMLLARIQANPQYQYQITFVGHSMGTIVLNRLFNVYLDEWTKSQAIEQIIYMGAACSVWEGLQALTPILEAANRTDVGHGSPRQPLKFYNLMLHPLAEMSEEMFPLAVPSGSLLYLIDTHLESPYGPLDRTLGSQVNMMSAIEAFKNIRQYCIFKGFDFVPGRWPEAHGDFSLCPFWWEDFRNPTRSNTYHGRPTSTYPKQKRWLEVYKEQDRDQGQSSTNRSAP